MARLRLPPAVAATLLAIAAAPAFAQETQQDVADRIVREQEQLRASQLERVMSAPARAFDHVEKDPYSTVRADEPEKPEAPPPAPPAPIWRPPPTVGRGFPWLLVACLIPVIPLALLGIACWRRWRFD